MAASDYFLCIDGIKGESHDAAMQSKGCIDIESFSWGVSQGGTFGFGGGGGAGRALAQDFHFVMKVNKASPDLMLACASGKHFPGATLILRKAGGKQEVYATFKLTDLLVSSFQTGGTTGSELLPIDQISLNFSRIEWEYRMQKPDGTPDAPVKGGYDFKANKKL